MITLIWLQIDINSLSVWRIYGCMDKIGSEGDVYERHKINHHFVNLINIIKIVRKWFPKSFLRLKICNRNFKIYINKFCIKKFKMAILRITKFSSVHIQTRPCHRYYYISKLLLLFFRDADEFSELTSWAAVIVYFGSCMCRRINSKIGK